MKTKISKGLVDEIFDYMLVHKLSAYVQEHLSRGRGSMYGGKRSLLPEDAERVAALNMYINTGETKIKRLIAFRSEPPKVNGGMPCGACREFLMQLSYENRNMEILTDYESRKTVLLKDIVPNWWGDRRYNND